MGHIQQLEHIDDEPGHCHLAIRARDLRKMGLFVPLIYWAAVATVFECT